MSRKIRIRKPNLTYNTYSRCIEWKNMMQKPVFKELFIDVLRLTQHKYQFSLISYQIMDNHFHMIIKTLEGKADISRIMQYFKSRFAERFNKKVGRIGPFWNERFKDVIAEKDKNPREYLMNALWRIAYNPVRKGMVNNPREYRYGSINMYIIGRGDRRVKIRYHEYFIELGKTFFERATKFIEYEKKYLQLIFYA
jgi:putative transposase